MTPKTVEIPPHRASTASSGSRRAPRWRPRSPPKPWGPVWGSPRCAPRARRGCSANGDDRSPARRPRRCRGGVPRDGAVVPRDIDPRRAARHRVRAAGRRRRDLSRLHRREPVRRLADRGAHDACCATASTATRTRSTRPRRQPRRCVERARAAVLRYFNAPTTTSTPASSRPTRPARCGSSARPIRSGRRTGSWPRSTTTTRSTASASSPAPRARGPPYVPLEAPDLRVAGDVLERYLERPAPVDKLFAYPAQSNFSGVKHPLEWIELAHERGWDVMLDCAAFVPTSRLDLSRWQAGLRADLVLQDVRLPDRRRRADRAPRRRSSGCGGRGSAAAPWSPPTSEASWSCRCPATRCSRTARSTTSGSRRSRSACATSSGSASTRSRSGSRRSARGCSRRCSACATPTAARRSAIYGPQTWDRRGATIAFNFLHPDGRVVDERFVDRIAAAHGVSVRTGCFCNPGAGETAFSLSRGRADRRASSTPG